MKVYYTITPDIGKVIDEIRGDARGAKKAGMISVVMGVEAIAKRNAPVGEGGGGSNLANSGTSEVNEDGSKGEIRFTAPYSRYVHEGTGLYGPHRTKIVPKTAKALYWPGARHPVRAVKGMEGQPFLTDAAEEADLNKLFAEGVSRYLSRT